MRILHYFLGFPPYRTGGLTKYAYDLMQTQVEDGHTVIALWPGQMGVINHKIDIKQRRDIDRIQNFELINSLPVSLDEGIKEFDAYMKSCNPVIYESFFTSVKPNIIHIHSLMGLPKEFVDVAQKFHIRTVFTTHDYYGICPKVTLYRYGVTCENDHGCHDCIQCNVLALSLRKIMIMQSPLYRGLKNSPIVKQLRKRHRWYFFAKEETPMTLGQGPEIDIQAEGYQKLRKYYVDILEKIDLIHFNSSVAEAVYKKYLKPKDSVVMTITHKNIADSRNTIEWKPGDKLRLTSLVPAKPFKGFYVLKQALDELWESGRKDFTLNVFNFVQNPSPYMVVKEEGFSQDELSQIFANTDVLVAPSIWYETFGFTVLEAISYGIPVIVSNHVGAKDIVGDGGIVVEAGNVEELKKTINGLNYKNILSLREKATFCDIKTWNTFIKQNYKIYKQC